MNKSKQTQHRKSRPFTVLTQTTITRQYIITAKSSNDARRFVMDCLVFNPKDILVETSSSKSTLVTAVVPYVHQKP